MTIKGKSRETLMEELEASRKRVNELEAYERNVKRAMEQYGFKCLPSSLPERPTHEGIAIIFDRKLEFINDVFAAVFGVSCEEACDPHFDPMVLVAPESRRLVSKVYFQGCRGGYKSRMINYTGLSLEGNKIQCETFLLFIPYKWGVAVQCTLKNVSVGQRVDDALRRHYSELPVSLPVNESNLRLPQALGADVFKKQL